MGHWTLQLLWILHQWTTTLDITAINSKNAVDIASMDNNIGHCSNRKGEKKRERERETWTLHHWTTTLDITTAVDIASMDNNIGQLPWTLQPLTTKKLLTLHQ